MSRLSLEITRFEKALGEWGASPDLRQAFQNALEAVQARWAKDAKARAYETALKDLPAVEPVRVDLDLSLIHI